MKRSKDMIISQILHVCANGAGKTQLVYQANLNFRSVLPYIELLSINGMINVFEENNQVRYKTTDKGLVLLDNFRQVQDMLSIDAEKGHMKSRNGAMRALQSS